MEENVLAENTGVETTAGQETVPEPPTKPAFIVDVTGSRLSATITLSRTSTNTILPEKADVEAVIKENNLAFGIDEGLVEVICKKPIYNIPLEIAKGKPSKKGDDGYLEYLVEKKRDLKPKINEDGTVDYRSMGFVRNVEENQELCRLYHATKGEDGCDVYGNVIDGILGKEPVAPLGKNTVYDEENSVLRSTVNGNVEVDYRGLIHVHDVLRLASVDNSTGDIWFGGDIIISGDVSSGFKVEAQGSILVKGTVGGATLKAKGDIMVGAGINGMDTAKIITESSLKCKYIQNCAIETGQDIFADSIMFCRIECNGNVELSGKRGALIGGRTLISDTLTAKTIGTSAHVPTHVTMAGGSLNFNKRLMEIKKRIGALDAELLSIIQTVSWCNDLLKKGQKLKPFQQNAYDMSKKRLEPLQAERNDRIKEMEEVQEEINHIDPGRCFIRCTDRVHSGVRIVFGTQIMQVSSSFANSRIYLRDREITVSPQ